MDEANEDRLQIEAPIEAVLRFGEISIGVPGEVEGMVSPRDRGLEITEHGVHVAELRMQDGLATAAGLDRVIANDFGGESGFDAGQCVADPHGVGIDGAMRPVLDAGLGEAGSK